MQRRPSQLAPAVAAARAHAHAAKIAEVAAAVAAHVADGRGRHAAATEVDEIAQKVGLDRADAQSDFGNVLSILERGAEDPAERAIVAAFVAAGVVRALEADGTSARRWGERLCYLGAHAGFDPLSAMPDEVDVEVLRSLYRSIAEFARQIDLGKVPTSDRAELLVATAALADVVAEGSAEGSSELQKKLATDTELAQIVSRLAADLSDPVGARLIMAPSADAPSTVVQTGPSSAALMGKLAPAPRGSFLTVLYALTGWLLIRGVAILIGDYILGLKRDARVELSEGGVELRGKVALLGREMRDLSAVYPLDGLSSIERDVRYPSLQVYAGLVALLLGTYAGVSFLSWGVQSASPRLLGYGVLALLAGVAIDLALTSLLPGARGRCRLVIVPKKGRSVCVAQLDIQSTDRMLADLSRRLR